MAGLPEYASFPAQLILDSFPGSVLLNRLTPPIHVTTTEYLHINADMHALLMEHWYYPSIRPRCGAMGPLKQLVSLSLSRLQEEGVVRAAGPLRAANQGDNQRTFASLARPSPRPVDDDGRRDRSISPKPPSSTRSERRGWPKSCGYVRFCSPLSPSCSLVRGPLGVQLKARYYKVAREVLLHFSLLFASLGVTHAIVDCVSSCLRPSWQSSSTRALKTTPRSPPPSWSRYYLHPVAIISLTTFFH